jgi:hypothetical protein
MASSVFAPACGLALGNTPLSALALASVGDITLTMGSSQLPRAGLLWDKVAGIRSIAHPWGSEFST